MVFASLILEREPMQVAEVPRALMTWLQNAGALAALGTFLVVLTKKMQRKEETRHLAVSKLALMVLVASWLTYAVIGLIGIANWIGNNSLQDWLPSRLPPPTSSADLEPPSLPPLTICDWLLTIGGVLALATVSAPLFVAIGTRLSGRRIWAVARLSFKEAVRSKVVLVFGLMVPVFLFAAWFIPYKPENQVRNYVFLVYICMFILFFLTTSLLGSMGIPNDVKSQSIHTIVTKPVEKFEIVLGRYLGYAVLLTLGLIVLTSASMLYIFRGVTEEAKRESFTARVPIFGRLAYHGTNNAKGENVGRMYDVRGYITGPQPNQSNLARQYAIWSFNTLPGSIGNDGSPVRFEFSFDIYRLTKGVENQGVLCTFLFADGRLPVAEFERVKERIKRDFDQLQEAARKQAGRDAEAMQKAMDDINRTLLRKHGVFVKAGFNVTDYHTQQIEVPAELFKHLQEQETANPRKEVAGEAAPPMFQVAVSVDFDVRGANQQLLGMARPDLYLLAAENSFFMNFIKGIIGMWCLMMLALGIAVACSAYLSGVISWLCTIFLLGAGCFVTDIQELAENRSPGGGPAEAMARLVSRTPIAGQLDDTPTTTVISGVDEVFRWWLRRFLNFVPDPSHYNLHEYIANGFDISWFAVLFMDNLLFLAAYLYPCALLAFYLMKYREIANPM